MRDDVHPFTRDEKRAAVAGWRAVPASTRWQTGRLAEKGQPADDPAVSAAARRFGECLLRQHLLNRLPRSALAVASAVALAAGLYLLTTDWSATPVPAMLISGGTAGTPMGLLSWAQRRTGHTLIAANPAVVRPSTSWSAQ